MQNISVLLVALFATVVRCQETIVDDSSAVAATAAEERSKEKRGISLNLGPGLEGYSYLGPSNRGLYRGYAGGYTPMTEYGYDGVNYGIGAQNFAGGYQGSYQSNGYNSPLGNYPYGYRGGAGYPTSYSYLRQYNTPVNTYPLGGIGTVGPYGSAAYGGYSGGAGGLGYNRFGYDNNNYNSYGGYQQPGLY